MLYPCLQWQHYEFQAVQVKLVKKNCPAFAGARRPRTQQAAAAHKARPRQQRNAAFIFGIDGKWCPRPDLNQHALAGNRF
jgi:hypothetical protein